jgi:hypothetical protein
MKPFAKKNECKIDEPLELSNVSDIEIKELPRDIFSELQSCMCWISLRKGTQKNPLVNGPEHIQLVHLRVRCGYLAAGEDSLSSTFGSRASENSTLVQVFCDLRQAIFFFFAVYSSLKYSFNEKRTKMFGLCKIPVLVFFFFF